MNERFLRTILILLMNLRDASSFGKHRRQKPHTETEDICDAQRIFDDPPDVPDIGPIDPHCNCGAAGFGIVEKIPYRRNTATCEPNDRVFSSACVRCGLCIAIAQQINATLLEAHEVTRCNMWLNDNEATCLLKSICDHAFKHHSLREVNGRKYLSGEPQDYPFVMSHEDITWQKRLKETCHEYLNVIKPTELYKQWQQWCLGDERDPDLTTVLCRSDDGLLRDCRNMEISYDLRD